MNCLSPILAAAASFKPASWLAILEPKVRNALLLSGLFAVVLLGVLIWVVFIRKPGHKRRRHHHHPPGWEQPPQTEKHGHRHHRRRQRSADLPRNPTRAETGGLPPLRTGSQEPPPPPA